MNYVSPTISFPFIIPFLSTSFFTSSLFNLPIYHLTCFFFPFNDFPSFSHPQLHRNPFFLNIPLILPFPFLLPFLLSPFRSHSPTPSSVFVSLFQFQFFLFSLNISLSFSFPLLVLLPHLAFTPLLEELCAYRIMYSRDDFTRSSSHAS